MTIATPVAEDEEISGFTDEPDGDDDDSDESGGSGGAEISPSRRGRASSYEEAERRAAASVTAGLAKYRKFLDKKLAERKVSLELKARNRLDEWAMAHIGTENVRNPEAVTENVLRSVRAAEARVAQFREQLAKLSEAGVDVAAIQATLDAPQGGAGS